jgi:ABC-type nitrate/sulfonate/bicarbonate transport system substrate-binding protein
VQAALTTFGLSQPADVDALNSLGGVFDAAIFIFYKSADPITKFAQFQGKRVAIGMPGTAQRLLMLDVLKATGAMDSSIKLADLDYNRYMIQLAGGTMTYRVLRDSEAEVEISTPAVASVLLAFAGDATAVAVSWCGASCAAKGP